MIDVPKVPEIGVVIRESPNGRSRSVGIFGADCKSGVLFINLSTNISANAQWSTRVVTYSGQPAPGTDGAVFGKKAFSFKSKFITNSGTVLFNAPLEPGIGDAGDNETGVWIEKDGVLPPPKEALRLT